jgi:hypothetical protein
MAVEARILLTTVEVGGVNVIEFISSVKMTWFVGSVNVIRFVRCRCMGSIELCC